MKKSILYIAIATLLLSSCSLDEFPEDQISPENFFRTENDLRLYCNSFYSALPGAATFYEESTDDVVGRDMSDAIRGTRVIPNTGGDWVWTDLRNINFFLEHSHQCTSEKVRNTYDGEARFFRAYFYFKMVKKFGDVPWYDRVLGDKDPDLYKPRTPRTEVLENMMEDLDFAIANLPESKSANYVNKWTALLLKSRICLYEGTWRKYHTEFNIPEADVYLDLAAKAAYTLLTEGPYTLHDTGTPSEDYRDIFVQTDPYTDEVLLSRCYNLTNQVYHDSNYYRLSSTTGLLGLEKDFVNTYLMNDGSRFTDNPGYKTMSFYDEVQDRDPRLAQSIRTPGYTRIGQSQTLAPDLSVSITGYQLTKYLSKTDMDGNAKSWTSVPLFRLAEAMLNYAEAKAELGTITQDDIDITINRLRKRVGMTGMLNLEQAKSNPDPVLEQIFFHNVDQTNKGIIMEVRRERSIELLQEGFRWDDMMRWKEGAAFLRQQYGQTMPFKGMYFPGTGSFDLDGDGKADVCIWSGNKPDEGDIVYRQLGQEVILENGTSGCILINSDKVKNWNEDRDYLQPVPVQERRLNPSLTQNPGWIDGLGY